MQFFKEVFTVRFKMLLLFIFIMILLLGEAFIKMDKNHKETILHDSLLTTGIFLSQNIQKNIVSSLEIPKTLSTILTLVEYDVSDFNNWAKDVFTSHNSLLALQLAPAGIVSYCYPMAGNESVIGHDLLHDKTRDDGARKTIESKKLTFVGPVKLKQNNKWGIIVRQPIFREVDGIDQFWGFSIAIMLLEDVLPNNMDSLEKGGMTFMLKGDNPDSKDSPIFYKSEGYEPENQLIVNISVPNGSWQFALNHTIIKDNLYFILRITLALLGILICSYIVLNQIQTVRNTKEVLSLNSQLHEQSIRDKLTGIGNRRYGEEILIQLINESQRYKDTFSIALMDIDYFKDINDNYGHLNGDTYLKHFTTLLSGIIRESDLLIRYGGDEFLLLFPRTELSQVEIIFRKIYKTFQQNPCRLQNDSIILSFSTGVAEYKIDEQMDSLFERADIQLYKSKNTGRNTVHYDHKDDLSSIIKY